MEVPLTAGRKRLLKIAAAHPFKNIQTYLKWSEEEIELAGFNIQREPTDEERSNLMETRERSCISHLV